MPVEAFLKVDTIVYMDTHRKTGLRPIIGAGENFSVKGGVQDGTAGTSQKM
jgi:hypothetical protein